MDEPKSYRVELTRAKLADALVERVRFDEVLAGAICINEAWDSGYIGRLLVHAEVLASQALLDPGSVPDQAVARAAVEVALGNSNPGLVLDRFETRPSAEMVASLIELLTAQARFHGVAASLERRSLRRTPPPSSSPMPATASSYRR